MSSTYSRSIPLAEWKSRMAPHVSETTVQFFATVAKKGRRRRWRRGADGGGRKNWTSCRNTINGQGNYHFMVEKIGLDVLEVDTQDETE